MNRKREQTTGERIKEWRTQQGYSMRGFAKRVGLSPRMMQKIEGGLSSITAPTALKLARVMRVRASALCDWKRKGAST